MVLPQQMKPITAINPERAPAPTSRDLDRRQRLERQDAEAETLVTWQRRHGYYRGQVQRWFAEHTAPDSRVLHIGCSIGDLLSALRPATGLGIDLSPRVIEIARQRHPHLRFEAMDPVDFELDATFDSVLIDTALADSSDLQGCLACAAAVCHPGSRLLLCHYNALWEPLLRLASFLRLRRPTGPQNWLGPEDFDNLLALTGFERIASAAEMLLPLRVPLLAALANRFVARFWPFRHFCLNQCVVARRVMPPPGAAEATCTVVVPTRNERGNIENAVARLPPMGRHTEIIFVDGNSTDGTAQEIERVIAARPQMDIKLIHQGDGVGKGDAVRKGFAAATGDVLIILDADLTVAPEDMPRFFDAIVQGKGEFVNGTRLVYPMESQAMRFLNKVANRFFSLLFTWLLGQRFRDTLCGTKALTRTSYAMIAAGRGRFGDFDPFGDFDLIFGAVAADRRVLEIPVRYRARTYGATNIHRFRHGWLLLKMSWVAFRRLKLR